MILPEWLTYRWFLPETFQGFIWEKPFFLFGLLLLPILFLLKNLFSYRKKEQIRLSPAKATKGSKVAYLRFLQPLFFFLALAFAIIALARPQVLHTVEEEIAKGIDIVLAIDISESMLTEDIGTNRLEVAKSVAKEFVKKRQNDRIGLVVFAGQSVTLCPLTTDHEILEDYLSNINSQDISSQGTAIGNAVATSINRLRDSQGNSKVIILLSDGDNTAGNIGPETSMALAKSFGIRIYSIALGLQNALEFDTQSLSTLAVNTKGSFFKVNSKTALSNVFNEIDSLERKKFENITMRDVTDYYYIYLNWVIIFVLLSLIVKVSPVGNLLED